MPRKPPPPPDPSRDAFDASIGIDALADRAFGRAAGAHSSEHNAVSLLLDGAENFPAWLDAIRRAQRLILFECYIVDDDVVGREFAGALADRARDGVQVYVLYDWLGSRRARELWDGLREAGVHVAMFNPLQLTSPLGWITRDHRKTIAIDGRVGFVSGLCVSGRWLADPARGLEAWRDTGVEIRGPAVADLELAFFDMWRTAGEAPPQPQLLTRAEAIPHAGDMRLRVVAGRPSAAGTFRLDLLIAAVARKRLWLTDAYFVGTAAYVQALRAASADGVDVRLLVPGASDIPAVAMLSRAAYRALLGAGIRVFEWNGTMLHAKSAVADSSWSRIGSTNLNLASFVGNYELDVAIEDAGFAERMAAQFERDLCRATEVVLTPRNRVRRVQAEREDSDIAKRSRVGSTGRAVAGAVSVGSALGAALTNRRALGPAESGLLIQMAVVAIVVGLVAAWWPKVVAWPAAVIAAWIGLTWLGKAWSIRHDPETHEHASIGHDEGRQPRSAMVEIAPGDDTPGRAAMEARPPSHAGVPKR